MSDTATVRVSSTPETVILRLAPDGDDIVTVRSGPEQVRVVTTATTGPAGAPGSAGYSHTQVLPALVWTVQHHLGHRPGGVHVMDDLGNEVEGVVTHLNADVLIVTFVEATRGVAAVS